MIKRIFVEKKAGFNVEACNLMKDLKDNLSIDTLKGLRILNMYDIEGINEEEYEKANYTIFAEKPVDYVYDEKFEMGSEEKAFAVEYLPGQYDQRADSAAQCLQLLTQGERREVRCAKVFILEGIISEEDFSRIKKYCINPVDSREAILRNSEEVISCKMEQENVEELMGFINLTKEEVAALRNEMGLAMSAEDLEFSAEYFRNIEKRNPTMTEIKVLDTYWSDHCRHTTFMTEIEDVHISEGRFTSPVKRAYEGYLNSRAYVYGEKERALNLMDIAVIGMKELRKRGLLEDLDVSEEINACSINVKVDVDGKEEDWLVMFKNETHNHPTEIEPFGGAATCLGGAIRDPLSGRSYVYQAMRVTGAADPRTSVEDTLSGKLPQRKITIKAAEGYSSYGNQIGLATGQVAEVYHEDFVAKRMELGAVIAAAPKKNVKREVPSAGDVIILLGGRTGRDGCGGATGSSKEHTEESIHSCGAEVQKGNAPTERKIQRLFRNPEVSTLIKRCNDFGAGGVAVAIGELADGLKINLDLVPKKYEGLNGTELAISESQERMAVVIEKEDMEKFIALAEEENLEATVVAEVTEEPRLRMMWNNNVIVDIERAFLNTSGVTQRTKVKVEAPKEDENYFNKLSEAVAEEISDVKKAWLKNLKQLNVCSQKGLVERFDSSIGSGTVLMPFGGRYQNTPVDGMVAKIPVLKGETSTGTIMTYGYNPVLSKWSPFHGALYAVVEAAAKAVSLGGNYSSLRLSLQEYFGKPGTEAERWGKPFSALLGALYAQKELGIAAIGGKDSMSGSFKEIDVPPTLVAFAVDSVDVNKVISPEFKGTNNKVVLIKAARDEEEIPVMEELKKNFDKVQELIGSGFVLAAQSVKAGGIGEVISKMCFGNMIGISLSEGIENSQFFSPEYGSIVLELSAEVDIETVMGDAHYSVIGTTRENKVIEVNGIEISLEEALRAWAEPLEGIFPSKADNDVNSIEIQSFDYKCNKSPITKTAKPKIFIPVFPGNNCEYDSKRAFERAGGEANTFIFRNLTNADIEWSIEQMVKGISNSQIVMIPGGFSAGDEPEGSGKFIATAFRNPRVKEAVMELLKNRDGLMLGICNGFQALIKLGLLPYGEIRDITEEGPTLTYNKIGRHVSTMVNTKVTSTLSPWFNNAAVGDIHTVAVSHGEGRFVAPAKVIEDLIRKGQVATQYVDLAGNATYEEPYNPNGSMYAIEGITSEDGRVFGKMAHSERIGANVSKNIEGNKVQMIFEAGINYFK